MIKLFYICMLMAATLTPSFAQAEDPSPLYEMRVYYAAPGKLAALEARLRDHTMKLFEKHGMTNVGYWVPIGENKESKLIYVLAYPNPAAREKSWKEFMNDPDWQTAWKESEKNGKVVDKIDSFYLKLTDYSPKPAITQSGNRVFELRTYTTPAGKLENLNSRFRDHTLNLFKKHGMENLWYWVKTSGQPGADTTLIYFLAHKNQEAAKASFDGFRKDPDWIKARTESEKDGALTVQGGVKSEFFVPTDYSPLK